MTRTSSRLGPACRHFFLALLLVVPGTACRNRSDDARGEPSAPGAAIEAGRAFSAGSAIESFEPASRAASRSRSRLNTAVLSAPEASREAALAQLHAENPDVRLAAVYVLSRTLRAGDADALAPLLESRVSRERVLAAAALLALGDRRAVPVLIAALGVEDPLPFGDPPLRVWQQARLALLSFTGQDFGLRRAATAGEAAATAPAFREWWAKAEGSFEVVRTPGRFGR